MKVVWYKMKEPGFTLCTLLANPQKPLFLDPELEVVNEYADVVCNGLGVGRFLCNVITTSEGGSASGTGVIQFDPDDLGTGTGTWVLTGATDEYAGLMTGKVTSEYTDDLITHSVCIQAPPAFPTE